MSTWILTRSGRKFDFANPQPSQIEIMDIADGLSKESRFCGQTRNIYTVAQHSVMASLIVPREFQLEALLHDAHEAFCKDIPSPLKTLLPDYRKIERRVDLAIRRKFSLPETMSLEVHQADMILRATEKRDLMPQDDEQWPDLENVRPLQRAIFAAPPSKALGMFCRRWMELTAQQISEVAA